MTPDLTSLAFLGHRWHCPAGAAAGQEREG
jgi:hypothetical protein